MRISDWSSDVCSSVLTWRHVLSTPSKRCGSPGPPFTRTPMSTSEVPRRLLADPLARAALGVTTLVSLLLYLVTLGDLSFDSADRKRVVSGTRVSVRVDLGGRRIIKKKKKSQHK